MGLPDSAKDVSVRNQFILSLSFLGSGWVVLLCFLLFCLETGLLVALAVL